MLHGSGHEGQTLVIRANAGAAIGAGHVMRCLALAQAWQAGGGKAHFRLGGGSPSLENRLAAEGMEVSRCAAVWGSREDAVETGQLALRMRAAAVAADGYVFAGEYQGILKERAARLLIIDDNGECAPHRADLILNQNPHAHADMYRDVGPGCALLLGCRYALLRKEFLSVARAPERNAGREPRNLLVTLGGGDPDNVTLKVIRALQTAHMPGLQAKVVVGMVNPNMASLEAAVAEGPSRGIVLVKDPGDMPALMAWADLAVSAAGSTVWELSYFGLPTLLITVADNQRGIAAVLAKLGSALDLGWHADLSSDGIGEAIARVLRDPALRSGMACKGREMIDGQGARRVARALAGGEER